MPSNEKAAMASNEQTPLLTIVRVAPPKQRYRHSTLRRFCTIALGTALVIIVVLFLLPLQWLPRDGSKPLPSGHPHKSRPDSNGITYKELQHVLLHTPKAEKAREWSNYYTAGPHLAGKNLSQAIWTRDRWQEFGVENTEIIAYDIYINYPLGHRLALLEKSGQKSESAIEPIRLDKDSQAEYKVQYECSLEEDVLEEDRTSGLPDRVPTFHGYSASGNVTGQFVYANFGTYQDYDDLVKANVSLEGKIAVVKYGHVFRGLKVKRAQELGMIGCVIYTDPQEDGDITEANGYKPYPHGPARNPSSVQRGSTQFLSKSRSQSICINAHVSRRSSRRSHDPRLPFEAGCAPPRSAS